MKLITRRGRAWTMHRTESLAWLLEQRPESFDALLADPPYSSGGFTRGDRLLPTQVKYLLSTSSRYAPDFGGDNRDQRGFLAWSTLWLTAAYRLVRRGAPAGVFADWRQLPTTTDAFQAGGFVWRGVAVWTKKNACRPHKGRFRSNAEFVVWGSRGPMPSRPDAPVLRGSWDCAPVHAHRRAHLTQKPVRVMEGLVAIAPLGGRVLDPFAGSGATGVACIRQGRVFVGVEQDRVIFERACDELADAERELRGIGRRAA